MNQALIQYLQQQMRTLPDRLRRFTHSTSSELYPQRLMFEQISQYINDFLEKKSSNKMIIIPGFRGVGKTTLMAQLCEKYQSTAHSTLFLSIEDAKNILDAGIIDVMAAYEEIIGNQLENIKEPTLFFLDEIQSDPKWAITLKSLFEKTTHIFFCCSGSSAVTLQTTPNLARRAIFEKLPPLCFTEYEMIKNNIHPPEELRNKIFQTIYFSKDANEVFNKLLKLQSTVHTYWIKVNRFDIKKFLSYGTLPFALTMPNETVVYDSIALLLDKIIKSDLPTLGNFNADTLNAVKRILFAITENDVASLNTLEKNLHINRLTIASVFDAMEKAELLIKIPAYGSNMTAAKKSNKYLFMSPAIRMSFFYFTGIENTYSVREGKLLEDLVGSHLYREFILKSQGAIRYDSAQGGADFILQILNNKQMIIEVGIGNKGKDQIVHSTKKIYSDYNLIFSNSRLAKDQETNTVFIPLDFFLLM